MNILCIFILFFDKNWEKNTNIKVIILAYYIIFKKKIIFNVIL